MVSGCLLAPHEATNIVTLERESSVTTRRRRTRKNSAARASHKEKVGVGDSTSTKQVPPPKVFPAMRPALFAQALRARGSAGRAHDETPLRDFRGVLFFRRMEQPRRPGLTGPPAATPSSPVLPHRLDATPSMLSGAACERNMVQPISPV